MLILKLMIFIVNAPLEARNKLGGSLFERIDTKTN